MELILFEAGAAGDLVAATIDPYDYTLYNNRIMPLIDQVTKRYERIKLRTRAKDILTDDELDLYIKNVKYKSLASHAFDYHIRKKHKFILIDSSEERYAKWATNKYNQLSPKKTRTGNYLQYHAHINCYEKLKNHTNRFLKLKDILNGNMLFKLEILTGQKYSDKFYKKWLENNKF